MLKHFKGYCPIQEKNQIVTIDYVDISTFEGSQYLKGNTQCEYNMVGDKCDISKCPIVQAAPINIRG